MPKVNPFVLRRQRTKKGWTQEALAAKAKVDKQTISRLERGQQSEAREYTIQQIAEALGVNEGILMGESPLPEPRSYDATLSRMDIEISTLARNALYFVSERYGVPKSSIVELAPFLFYWAAEASLHERRKSLGQLSDRLSEEVRSDVLESIEAADLFGEALTDNPFELFLRDLAENIGKDALLNSFNQFDFPDYRICSEEAVILVDGEADLADQILSGFVPLHEMPRELEHGGMYTDRVEWVRKKADEFRRTRRRDE